MVVVSYGTLWKTPLISLCSQCTVAQCMQQRFNKSERNSLSSRQFAASRFRLFPWSPYSSLKITPRSSLVSLPTRFKTISSRSDVAISYPWQRFLFWTRHDLRRELSPLSFQLARELSCREFPSYGRDLSSLLCDRLICTDILLHGTRRREKDVVQRTRYGLYWKLLPFISQGFRPCFSPGMAQCSSLKNAEVPEEDQKKEISSLHLGQNSLLTFLLFISRILTLATIWFPIIMVSPFIWLLQRWRRDEVPSAGDEEGQLDAAMRRNRSSRSLRECIVESYWWIIFWAVEASGPTFIKFMQWASTRSDIFPEEFCGRISRFHSKVGAHPFPATQFVLEQNFGTNWRNFLRIEPTPIGSGCVAQVYRGCFFDPLTANEKAVAVKVIHPHVRERMKLDIQLMYFAARTLSKFGSLDWLPFYEAVEQFDGLMTRQLNLLNEAQNMQIFRQNFENVGVRKELARFRGRMVVPQVYFASPDLIIETYERGDSLSEWLKNLRSQSIRESAAQYCGLLQAASIVPPKDKHLHRGLSRRCRRWFSRRFRRTSWEMDEMGPLLPPEEENDEPEIRARRKSPPANALYRLIDNVGRLGLTAFLQMLFVDNFVHADLHPGNILIRFPKGNVDEKSTEESRGTTAQDTEESFVTRLGKQFCRRTSAMFSRVAKKILQHFGGWNDDDFAPDFEFILLDCGITTTLSPKDRKNFMDLFRSIVMGDGYHAGRLILERSPRQSCPQPQEFCQEVAELIRTYHKDAGGSLRLGTVRLGDILSKMLKLSLRHRVELDAEFVSVLLAIMILEGVGRQITPDLDLLRWAAPYLIKSSLKKSSSVSANDTVEEKN